jgi:hypothetical protein
MVDESFEETLQDIEALATAVPYLYVLYAEGSHWIKVGQSVDVPFRMQSLQGGNPLRLRVLFAIQRPDAAQVEEVLKAHLSLYKVTCSAACRTAASLGQPGSCFIAVGSTGFDMPTVRG